MKAFEYAEASTEAEIVQLVNSTTGVCELLAGGTDLVGLMKKMAVTPDRVVNILEVESMQYVEPTAAGGVRIGAVVHLDDLLESPYMEAYPAVLQAVRGINSMQLQSQGTIGGEVCQRPRCWYFRSGHDLLAEAGQLVAGGDNRLHAVFGNSGPAKFVSGSRTAPALISLGAQARVIGPQEDEERLIPLAEFYRTPRHLGQRENVLQPGQVVTHLVLPPAPLTSATYEVRQSEGPDYPLASAAATLHISGGVIRQASVVLGMVAPTPWISQRASEQLIGQPASPVAAEAAAMAAISEATPLSENGYKVDLAKTSVKRAVLAAAGLETGGF